MENRVKSLNIHKIIYISIYHIPAFQKKMLEERIENEFSFLLNAFAE